MICIRNKMMIDVKYQQEKVYFVDKGICIREVSERIKKGMKIRHQRENRREKRYYKNS